MRYLGSGDSALAVGDPAIEKLSEICARQKQRSRILLADALATMLAGPAYAYAAILLRLNPLGSEREVVSDRERAATILAVLRSMNACPPGAPPPLGDIVDALTEYWRESVGAARAEPVETAAPELDAPPPIDPETWRDQFRNNIVNHKHALYEHEHADRADEWSAAWCSAIENGRELKVPSLAPGEHIREALNAAWDARVQATRELEPSQADEAQKRVERIAEIGLTTCEAIMAAKQEMKGDPGGGTDPGRAPRPVSQGGQ